MPVIDETIAEVDLDGGPMPLPFAAHDPRAITVGSSSKSHWGGLRTGWVRAPAHRAAGLVESRVTSDLGAPVLEQLVLLELMRVAPGLTPERRDDLRASRDALVAALRRAPARAAVPVPRGGLFLWCELPDGLDATGVAVAAEDEGLLVAAGPRFSVAGGLAALGAPAVRARARGDDGCRRTGSRRAVETVRAGGAAVAARGATRPPRRPAHRPRPRRAVTARRPRPSPAGGGCVA